MLGFLLVVELATLSRSGLLGLGVGLLVLAVPYRRRLVSRDLLVPLAASLALVGIVVLSRLHFFETVIRSRFQTGGSSTSAHFGVYDFIPQVLSSHPLFGLGFNNFSVYYELVTGKTNWGPHSFYVALLVETGLVGDGRLRRLPLVPVPAPAARCAIGRRLAAAGDPAAGARAAAGVGPDRRARRHARGELLLPDDDLLLLLRARSARPRRTARLRAPAAAAAPARSPGRSPQGRLRTAGQRSWMKVVVLTTSYPRSPEDVVGRFVADAVERLRRAGVEVEVVSPLSFRPLRDRVRLTASSATCGGGRGSSSSLPAMLVSFTRAAREAARGRRPRARALAAGRRGRRARRASRTSSSSGAPTSSSRGGCRGSRAGSCGVRGSRSAPRRSWPRPRASSAPGTVRVIPSGVDVPRSVGEPDEPPHVLYAGRLSPEKGVLELVEAAHGLPLVVAGDGPLRDQVPEALGFVPHDELLRLYERAAVVACPSLREGFGVACAEAMAHGRPVVAGAVGGLRDLVVDGETGLLVPPGDVAAPARRARAAARRRRAPPAPR